jgi:uncharacterized repeat protein (TIGR03803 family)
MSAASRNFSSQSGFPAAIPMFALVVVLSLGAGQLAQAQTFTVLHTFTGGADGKFPYSGLTIDRAGRFYGTTQSDTSGGGTVFRLARQGSGWVFAPLYHFHGNGSGAWPEARVVFGPDGTLYGTTQEGGNNSGVVYNLRPPPTACPSFLCAWTETVLYEFTDFDGYDLDYGDLAFDQQGDLYGTTEFQGDGCYGGESSSNDGGYGKLGKHMRSLACSGLGPDCGGAYGNVYRMTPGAGGWNRTAVYTFTGLGDGGQPTSGVILDPSGNLYGTASWAGAGYDGLVFQMVPGIACYQENILYAFTGGSDGKYPVAGLVRDAAGNLYGATSQLGSAGGGTVFELTPSNGGWTFHLLYSLSGSGSSPGPLRNLSLDAAGDVYGTTYAGGAYGYGSIFKLTPGNGTWTYTSLHDFTNGNDGAYPYSNVVFDANGNLYGTASQGGANNFGVVWEITP